MRILMLGCKEYPYGISSKFEKFPGGGTAKYVINLAEGLAKKGHEIHLIVRQFPGQRKYEKINTLHIHRVSYINNKYLRNPSFSRNSKKLAKKLVNKIKFDVIHTHGLFGTYAGIKLKTKTPIISTLHGVASTQVSHNYNKLITAVIKKLQKRAYSKPRKLLFLSKAEQEDFVNQTKIRLTKENSTIIYPSVKDEKTKRKKTKDFNVVFIGRLVPMKGLNKLIKSFKLLKKQNIKYIIVGNGFEQKKLEKLTKKLNLGKNITFTGYTNNIKKYLEITSLFILPSEGGEGLPAALLEAMSTGIPCMLSNFEAPIDKKAVILLKDNKPETIAKEIDNLTKKQLENLGKRAKEEYKKKFSIESFVKNHIKIYKEVMK